MPHARVPATKLLAQVAWVLFATAAEPSISPSLEQARLNAFPIFNSIHSAMRQWGSSLNHNGLAMIPAKVPKGNLLYHGTHSSDPQTRGLEWLAFEPEHSEIFSLSWRARRQDNHAVHEQALLQRIDDTDRHASHVLAAEPSAIRGYLRTYQASRDLNLLYIDGMSAAKGCLGTLDTQDLVLRMINGTSPCDTLLDDILRHDIARVGELCGMLTPLGYDGLLRMEAGFEIVYCDFDDGGLRLRSQLRRPFWDEMMAWYDLPRLAFHVVRAATQHYGGMAESGRVQLDFSRMVSAYFYPVNVSNPDDDDDDDTDTDGHTPARRLPRLLSTTQDERRSVQRRVQEVAGSRDGPVEVAWQAVVDAVVSRYADRLAVLAQLSPDRRYSDAERFAAEIFVATNTHVDDSSTPDDVERWTVDGPGGEAAARSRCQNHHVQQLEASKSLFTPEDHLIYASVVQVTGHICSTLFQARSSLQDAYRSELCGGETRRDVIAKAAVKIQKDIQQLVSDLQWTRWETCGVCAMDELCFLPMFPFGSTADRQGPRCLNESGLDVGLDLENNYWQLDVRSVLSGLTGPL